MKQVPTDIAIAQAAKPRPIAEVAAEIGLSGDEILPYGKTKAKITPEAIAAFYRERGAAAVVVKLGAEGSYWCDAGSEGRVVFTC